VRCRIVFRGRRYTRKQPLLKTSIATRKARNEARETKTEQVIAGKVGEMQDLPQVKVLRGTPTCIVHILNARYQDLSYLLNRLLRIGAIINVM